MTDGEKVIKVLYQCTPFAEIDYDYLVVICRNNQGKVMPSGLRITKDFLSKLKIAIDTEDVTLIEQLNPPFPQEITTEILQCFDNEYEILMPIVSGYEGVDRIAELLWAFSKYHEELLDERDIEYRKSNENNLKNEILNLLKSFEIKISTSDFDKLSQLCDGVFKGTEFNDLCFNDFYNNLINKSQEQMRH